MARPIREMAAQAGMTRLQHSPLQGWRDHRGPLSRMADLRQSGNSDGPLSDHSRKCQAGTAVLYPGRAVDEPLKIGYICVHHRMKLCASAAVVVWRTAAQPRPLPLFNETIRLDVPSAADGRFAKHAEVLRGRCQVRARCGNNASHRAADADGSSYGFGSPLSQKRP